MSELDVEFELQLQFTEKFRGALDEYLFLTLTEDCHPLIDRCEQVVCAMLNEDFTTYNNGESEWEDSIRDQSHKMAQRVIERLLKHYVENY